MNINEVRSIIRQVIAEAMEEKGNKLRTDGKLVNLKKEMEGLKRMKEALGQYQISEGSEQQFIAEFVHMERFVNEFNKIKEAHARLSEMLDKQINEVDDKIKNETYKIKEMMGLIEKAKKPAEKKEKKADKDASKSKHEKGESKEEEEEEHDEEPKPKKKPAAKKDK